jgi:DNA-binding NtrC family response regulator
MNDSAHRRPTATTKEASPRGDDSNEATSELALVVVHSPDQERRGPISLDGDLTVVGRDVDGAGISIDDARLSRVHFRVMYDGRARSHRVGDARSKNGTFLQGSRVESATLRSGDVLRAGDTVFVYGNPDPIKTTRGLVGQLGKSDLSVLVLGETGSGKERVARALHEASGRKGPFVAVNCAALPKALLGAELFGHTRGAFSGAVDTRRGLFQTASDGTLFLDEVADAPLDLQVLLLRAVEEHKVRPLGSDREVEVNTRVIAATNGDLEHAVLAKTFRADLHARLAHATIRLSPLRERRVEILALAAEFANDAVCDWKMTADAAEALVRHDWRYNVREIQSLVRRFVSLGKGTLDSRYLKEHHPEILAGFRRDDSASPESAQPPAARDSDRSELVALLRKHRGNVSAVADEMQRPRTRVYRRLKALGLDPDRYRS